MERRSTRGRQSVDSSPVAPGPSSSTVVAPTTTTTTVTVQKVPEPVQTSPQQQPEVNPEIGFEEVVLNRRGMPARQRKKNRFYFDDEIMITSETPSRKSTPKSPVKKIKLEPMEDSPVGNVDSMKGKGSEGSMSKGARNDLGRSSPRAGETPRNRVESGRGGRGDVSPVKSKTPQSAAGRMPLHTPMKIKKDPDAIPSARANRHEKEMEAAVVKSPTRGRPPSTLTRGVPLPIRIKKDPDASPRPVGRPPVGRPPDRDKARPQDKQREKQERLKEKDRAYRDKERKEARREKERQKDRDRDYTPGAGTSGGAKTRNRRGSSPSQYLGNRSASPELLMDLPKPCIDKKTAQDISIRLRNVLKLPKAHKWVCYEWFYSNVDKVLFEGENDFQICLKESFPTLKARKCARAEWCKIRRMMGKPRRCSQAFFDEEREELQRRRQKIRMIQQRKVTDFNYKELPDEIPLQLVIGTKVTARLRRPQDGLFTGTIDGVDTSNNTYRITFDRTGLGTHSIPDYEVLSNDNPETVSTSSFALKIPRRSYGGFAGGNFKFNSAALLGDDGIFGSMPKSPFPVDGMLGGFPIRLLDMIVRLSKLLKAKREKILQLKELNVEAEKMCSYSKTVNNDYRMRYARCVLDLDSMNKEMSMYLEGIQQYCLDIAPDHGANQMIVPEHIQEQCRQEAQLIVDTYNTKQNRNLLHNSKNLSLIANLTSLLLQIKTLGSGERNLYELKSIKDSIKEMRASLEGRNVVLFQNRVEIPVNQIQAGLCGSHYPMKGGF